MAEPITLTTEGLLLNWLKEVGDEVKSGDIIAEIEADKATVEIEAPADGVLLSQDADIGEELEEGSIIGQIGAAGEAPSSGGGDAAPAAANNGNTPGDAQAATAQPTTTSNGNSATRTEDGRIKASPVARNMAAERGIDLAQVAGSGPGGRIIKADVENFNPAQAAPAPAAAQAAPAPNAQAGRPTWGKLPQASDDVIIEDIDRMRQRIASGTALSKNNIPHFYVTNDIDVQPLLELRKRLNAELAEQGIKISVNDMIVKATALTLRQFPNLNSHYYGDKVVRYQRINVGIAVAIPNGLINVVSHDADTRSLSTMAAQHKAMFERARDGKVKPDDLKGATFTVSNLGPFDVEHFSAIINPPESGIIAVGSAKKVPVVLEDGTLGVGNRMKVTISVDHRVSDGAEGAEWLKYFKGLLENPMRLLV